MVQRQFIKRQFIERQFIECQFIERQFIKHQFIERRFVEYGGTSNDFFIKFSAFITLVPLVTTSLLQPQAELTHLATLILTSKRGLGDGSGPDCR
jgi:hypothetical protein